jgi:hypothetical protein
MNTLELIKDSCLFGGTVPKERAEEVRTFLDDLEKQLTIPVVVSSNFICNSENRRKEKCKDQCAWCDGFN